MDTNLSTEDLYAFADEGVTSEQRSTERPWKILISDDVEEVHRVTTLALQGLVFEGRGVTFLHAYSGAQTLAVLRNEAEIALLLQDVVMETDSAGLEVVRTLREELDNRMVRVILRTGQPGQAPERQVVLSYDINDYKEKTELTATKLYTAVISALRSYRDLAIIEKNRRGLEKIIVASRNLFELKSIGDFAQGVLIQIASLVKVNDSSLLQDTSGLTASLEPGRPAFVVVSGTGVFERVIGRPLTEAVDDEKLSLIRKCILAKGSIFSGGCYVGYFESSAGVKSLLFIASGRPLGEIDRRLILTFAANVSVAFENLILHQRIRETQLSVIDTLGEIIESRSQYTAHHTRRIGELAARLGELVGLGREDLEILRLASSMHDVGKVGIPDSILDKPERLSADEYELVKTHTTIGHSIFGRDSGEIHHAIAVVAHQHHEYWDGGGYPEGRRGEDIHLFARITCLVDYFDALTHRRPYKEAWPIERAREELVAKRGTYFDPQLVDLFIGAYEDFVKIVTEDGNARAVPYPARTTSSQS